MTERLTDKEIDVLLALCRNPTALTERLRATMPQITAVLLELQEMRKPCVWTWNPTTQDWDAACGTSFHIGGAIHEDDDNPTEQGINSCPKCGHPVQMKEGRT